MRTISDTLNIKDFTDRVFRSLASQTYRQYGFMLVGVHECLRDHVNRYCGEISLEVQREVFNQRGV